MSDLLNIFKDTRVEECNNFEEVELGNKSEPWTKEDDAYLISKYPNTCIELIAEALGRTHFSVIARASKLRSRGFVFSTFRKYNWTREEDEYILENYMIIDTKVMSEKLGRTTYSIANRVNVLRSRGDEVKGGHRRAWSKEEDEILMKDYLVKCTEEIAKELKRTPLAIQIRVHKLRTKHGKVFSNGRKGLPWTNREDKYLTKHYRKKSVRDIATDLNRTPGGVQGRARVLKL